MASLKRIDALLTEAVESKKMPGIVAMAATDKGVLYEGAFGRRELGKDASMTLDTVVWIASMTKAITATAAMQLVERGKLSLDAPATQLAPGLAKAQVLEGFDAAGQPRLRAPKRPITLRHLLTHTAGFAYEIWRTEIATYQTATNTPGITTCTNAALTTPLLFDPGEAWEYGINIDWVGKMVEAASGQKLDAYLQSNVLGPLGMKDTSFKLSPAQRARLASVHQRDDKGALAPIEFALPEEPEFLMGGGGLNGTAPDYLAFTQMILHGGRFNGAQVLRPETVEQMAQNHIGPLEIGPMKTAMPGLSKDVELFPGISKKWGLSWVINMAALPTGRAAGSLAWAGLANTYFWIDRSRRVCGVFLSQVLPFFDDTAIDLLVKFETEVYRALWSLMARRALRGKGGAAPGEVRAGAHLVAQRLLQRLARPRVLGDGGADLPLDRLHGRRAVGGDALGRFQRPRHQPLGGHDAIDQADPRRVGRVDPTRRAQELHRVHVADLLHELGRRAPERIDGPFHFGQPEARVRRRGAHVGGQEQLDTTARAVAVDGRHDRLAELVELEQRV